MAYITRAPAFMQDEASAKKLTMAPAERKRPQDHDTWYIWASTVQRGRASILSSVVLW